MSRTLVLTISDDDGDGVWVVTDDLSRAYGEGHSPIYALVDWLHDLDMRWWVLQRGLLAPGMAAEYERLREVLEPCHSLDPRPDTLHSPRA